MYTTLTALVAIFVTSTGVFFLAGNTFRKFIPAADYSRRRNLWLGLLVISFLSPSFWIYFVIAGGLVYWFAKTDQNPLAVYFLILFAVPPVQANIAGFAGINQILPLNHFKMLAIFLLVPVAISILSRQSATNRRWYAADICVLAYVILSIVLFSPYESLTNTVRRSLVQILEVLLPYFVIRNCCTSKMMLREAIASMVLGVLVLVPAAIIESTKHWLLFLSIGDTWGEPNVRAYLFRGDFLRAQTSAGHSLILGCLMVTALSLWFSLGRGIGSKSKAIAYGAMLGIGAIVTFARGAWIAVPIFGMAFLILVPVAGKKIIATLLLIAVICAGVLVSPVGEQAIAYLPFIGSVGSETVVYRQQLLDISWALMQLNPWFGSPNFLQYMESLRQGEGIIDLVNTYANIALSVGGVGLAFFVGAFLFPLFNIARISRVINRQDPDFSAVGASLGASIIAMLVVIATCSFINGIAVMAWTVSALAVNYVQIAAGSVRIQAARARFSMPHAV